jgi:hypothetical protein
VSRALSVKAPPQRNHCHGKNRLLTGDFHTTNNVKQDFTVYVRLEETVSLTLIHKSEVVLHLTIKKSIRKENKSNCFWEN